MPSIKDAIFTLALGLAACSSEPGPRHDAEPMDVTLPDDDGPDLAVDDFAIALSTDKLPVLQGTTGSVEIRLTRKGGFTGTVTVTASELPTGATASTVTFDGDVSKATLTVTAGADVPHSLPTNVTLRAAASSGAEVTAPLTVTVYGPPGSLDTSFAGGGKAMAPVGQGDDYAYALAVQPDGKILVAGRSSEGLGDFAVLRLERDGTPDASFGEGGKVTTAIGAGEDTAYAIAVQPDGRIVAAGTSLGAATDLDFALVRYMPDGTLDPSFGSGGKVTTAFGDDADVGYALLIEPDASIVVAGHTNQGSSGTGIDFALARYDASGKLDPTFGDGGKVVTSIAEGGARDSAYAIVVQEIDGERCILAAGGEGDFVFARYTPKGALDARFGAGGKVQGVWGPSIGAARAVTLTGDGKVLAAGHYGHDFAVVRMDANGALDQAFGDEGKVLTPLNNEGEDEAQALAVEADGKILVGGWVNERASTSGNFGVVRYDASGKLDPAFGRGGVVVTEVAAPMKRDVANAMLLQPDERVPATRVLLAGYATATSNFDFAITRYWR